MDSLRSRGVIQPFEGCRNAFAPVRRSLVWRENGRFFRLECKENKAEGFLICSAKDAEGKKHRLFFQKEGAF